MSTHTYKAGERRVQEILAERCGPRSHAEFMMLRSAFQRIISVLGGTDFEIRFTRCEGILVRTFPPPEPIEITINKTLGDEQE